MANDMLKSYKIKTYNQIAEIGLKRFKPDYKISDDESEPDAIILRSFNLHDEKIPASVIAVGRAGAGVNNVPVEKLSETGIVVFNAPGANANSVKELVIAGMLLAGRNIPGAIDYTAGLSSENMKEKVEAGKKKFVGSELSGKTLGVIGLGAIGYRIANAGIDLGMKVLGYDPAMTIQNAWQLSSAVKRVEDLDQLIKQSDYITIHVPLLEVTKGMISKEKVGYMKPNAILLNFSRDELVDEKEVLTALKSNKIKNYVTDFPNPITNGKPGVISLPHLGASTAEAEDNCAVMVADQLQDYLENGNVQFSVNFPNAVLSRKGKVRLCFTHKNAPGVVAQISNILGSEKINIVELLNKSRGDLAYTIVDLDVAKVDTVLENKLAKIPEVSRLRVLV